MINKQALLDEIQKGLDGGVITPADLTQFTVSESLAVAPLATSPPEDPSKKREKLSAVDVMFYIAGIILFSAIVSVIIQSWDDGSAFVHIMLSAGVGAGLWAVAYNLIKSPIQSDIRRGLINSLLLTGSLSVIVGGYIVTNEIIGGFEEINLLPAACMFAVLGAMHLGYDRLVKKDFVLLMGVLLSVATFPALLASFLQDADVSNSVWSTILVMSAVLLACATRVVVKLNPDRQKLHNALDSFAAFVGLMTMYVSSYGEYGILWLCVLIVAVFGIFYLSIIWQNKHLLGSGSFFLVLTVITISFKYFSGYGVTVSLVVAAMGLLGSAAIASGINKKYFKTTQSTEGLDRPAE